MMQLVPHVYCDSVSASRVFELLHGVLGARDFLNKYGVVGLAIAFIIGGAARAMHTSIVEGL